MNRPGKYIIGLCMITSIIMNTVHAMSKARTPNPIGVIVVDIQADFVNLPVIDPRTLQKISDTGALGVGRNPVNNQVGAYGDTDKNYIQAAEKFTQDMRQHNMPIFFTQDWHPKGHVSFASTWNQPLFTLFTINDRPGYRNQVQMLWPDHCVQGSPGARIILKVQPQDIVVQKGTNLYEDSYSGFMDKGLQKTPLASELHKRGVTDFIIYGIATDYCVDDTALDGLNEGFGAHLVINLSRGVSEETIQKKLAEFVERGGNIYYIKDLKDGWTPSTATIKFLKSLGLIECTNVSDFLNKVHTNIRKGTGIFSKEQKAKIAGREALASEFAQLGNLTEVYEGAVIRPSEQELKRGRARLRKPEERESKQNISQQEQEDVLFMLD